MLLRKGSRGREVIELQQALGIDDDGVFGIGTEQAVKAYQQEHHLMIDGIVGSQTLTAIRENDVTTDNSERVYSPSEALMINKYFLPKGEYQQGPTPKEYLFLHHTAGWHLGKNSSQHMHTHSVAIEICNFSYVENGKTYVGTPVVEDQLITLAKPFRGFRQWHAYSDQQIETLKAFILWIAERDSIDVRSGLVEC